MMKADFAAPGRMSARPREREAIPRRYKVQRKF